MTLRRNPAVSCTEVEGELFLVEPQSGEIFYLDAITSGVWRLLEAPRSRAEVIATVAAAFPGQPAERIAADVSKVVAELTDWRLLLEG